MKCKEENLMQAVKSGDVKTVQRLLRFKSRSSKTKHHPSQLKRFDLNYQNEIGMTSLHLAALSGNEEILTVLINSGANPDCKDSRGLRPIHFAACQGKINILKILLKSGSNPESPSASGDTPLHFAAQYGHYDIVSLLIQSDCNPLKRNIKGMTPLSLACEYGRCRVVELFLKSDSCKNLFIMSESMLKNPNNNWPPCIHLAAKNGHVDVLRCLILNGCDINIQTSSGTALHEAARNGRLEAVKFLLECGSDLTIHNSYGQNAYDVTINQKIGLNIKRLLRSFAGASMARAIYPHNDAHWSSLNFDVDEIITVLEKNSNGFWRGFILHRDLSTRSGYFLSSCVELINDAELSHGIDKRKSEWTEKTETVPDDVDSGLHSFRSSSRHASPSASCRNSTSSSFGSEKDSGVSSTNFGTSTRNNDTVSSTNTFSPVSSLRKENRKYSVASDVPLNPLSRIYDIDHNKHNSHEYINDASIFDSSEKINIEDMQRSGLADSEILRLWLTEKGFEEYTNNFLTNGYDIHIITKMTPQDLVAIGVTNPLHRHKLKLELSKLLIYDGLPEYVPHCLNDWLQAIKLACYQGTLNRQGICTIDDVLSFSYDDLEDIGITKLGHQKRFLLAVKKLQRLLKQRENREKLSCQSVPTSSCNQKVCFPAAHAMESSEFGTFSAVNSADAQDGVMVSFCYPSVPSHALTSLANREKMIKKNRHLKNKNSKLEKISSFDVLQSDAEIPTRLSLSLSSFCSPVTMRQNFLNQQRYAESSEDLYFEEDELLGDEEILSKLNQLISIDSARFGKYGSHGTGSCKSAEISDFKETFKDQSSLAENSTDASMNRDNSGQLDIASSNEETMPMSDVNTNENDNPVLKEQCNEENNRTFTAALVTNEEIAPFSDSEHVLTNIDVMLNNLNKELDAMLAYEIKMKM